MTSDGYTYADTCTHGTVERKREVEMRRGRKSREKRGKEEKRERELGPKSQNWKQGIQCVFFFLPITLTVSLHLFHKFWLHARHSMY